MKSRAQLLISNLCSVVLLFFFYSCTMNNDNSKNDIIDEPELPPVESTKEFNIVQKGQKVKFICEQPEESENDEIVYQWYSGIEPNGTEISGEKNNFYITSKITEKGIQNFYCTVTENEVSKSISFSVAYTELPTVYVSTPDNVEITSKEDWIKDAVLSIRYAKDSSWETEEITTSIRGRGNSTWSQPKKPYALKLDKKNSLLGMPSHKRWVLIANYLDNSYLRNSMAFYLSEQFGLDYTVRGQFVDLVLNGEYKGLYWLGEAIKVDEKRVDINDGSKKISDDEDKDYLIEMDKYFDEPVKFYSSIRNMPYMMKNDDYMIDDSDNLTNGGEARLNRLQNKITALENFLYPDFTSGMNTNNCSAPDESYSAIIDIDSWIKFYLVNEIMSNGELGHPKSCYFTFESEKNIFKAGPVWDFDWASLKQVNNCTLQNTIYYNALFKSSVFRNRAKGIWNEKSSGININNTIEILRNEISVGAEYDEKLWGVNHNPTSSSASKLEYEDYNGHIDFLKSTLQNKLLVIENYISALQD